MNNLQLKTKTVGVNTAQITAPQTELTEDQFIAHVLHLEAKDVNLKFIFDHIRNYTICGGLLWLSGHVWNHLGQNIFQNIFDYLVTGTLGALALTLTAFNYFHGLAAVSTLQDMRHVNKIVYIVASVLLLLVAIKILLFAK